MKWGIFVKKPRKFYNLLLAFIMASSLLAGCNKDKSDGAATYDTGTSNPVAAATYDTGTDTPLVAASEDSVELALSEEGVYDSKDEVALYIHIYGKLPSNYITKKEAKALGWEGGSLMDIAPGKCIGGDYFGNYEGLLPEEDGREYHECDIDTLDKKSRGAKRIIYSNDGYIYYTEDHYESFELLYEGE